MIVTIGTSGPIQRRFPTCLTGSSGPKDLAGRVVHLELARFSVFSLDGLIHLPPMNRDLAGGVDPQSNLVSANINDRKYDVLADHDALVTLPRQDKHRQLLPSLDWPVDQSGASPPLRPRRFRDSPPDPSLATKKVRGRPLSGWRPIFLCLCELRSTPAHHGPTAVIVGGLFFPLAPRDAGQVA